MKTITVYKEHDAGYSETCALAKRIYKEQLSFSLEHFPELLFAIVDETHVVGCMGFNTSLTSPLFHSDTRVRALQKQSGPFTLFGEQSVFALEHCSVGVPLLIAVVAEYAQSIGISRIAYAGIEVSMKTIEHLGFQVTKCGDVDLDLLPFHERSNYEPWNETYHPITCVLATDNAAAITHNLLTRFAHRVCLSEQLSSLLSYNHEQRTERKVA